MNTVQIKHYLTPGHSTYLSGIGQLKKAYPKLSIGEIKRFLSNIDAYTVHREPKQPRRYNPIFVRKTNVLWQADLAEMGMLAGHNDGIRYLLTVLDTFSRRAWIAPLKKKTGDRVWLAFRRILGKRRPAKLLTDRGTEFVNAIFKRGLLRLNIKSIHLHSEQKAAHVERFNRTIKRLIYTYLTQSGGKRYIDVLPDLLKTYNTRFHRTIKMTPMQADQNTNRKRVLSHLAHLYQQPKRVPQFTKDMLVRIKRLGHKFHRGFNESFSRHVYRIARVNAIKPIPTYFLSELTNHDEIEGGFYEEELQPVLFNDVFKKDKILKTSKDKVLVSWKGWGPSYNAWIDKTYLPLLTKT